MSAGFVDVEVVELLRESPDLLAIADSIGATQSREEARWRTPRARVVVLAAAVGVAFGVALVSPWDGRGGGFVAKALAALGTGQVVHVVSVTDSQGRTVLDLDTGAETPVRVRTEIWFDEARGLRRTIVRTGERVVTDALQTPQGSWTQGGRVYTCAWIAAHPVEATKARISCNASGENGTIPRKIGEPRPTLEPSLAGFATGYRDALASGDARHDGAGEIDGRAVTWLRFRSSVPPGPDGVTPTRVERVAVDDETLKPIVVETLVEGRQVSRHRITSIGTLEPDGVDFSRPKPAETATAVATRGRDRPIELAEAARALDGRVLWAGATLEGLDLAGASLREIRSSYGADSGVAPTHSTGVELAYGADDSTLDPYVVLKQSLAPELLYGFALPFSEPPPEGAMLVTAIERYATPSSGARAEREATVWRGQLVESGVYVTIEARTKALLAAAARALTREGLG